MCQDPLSYELLVKKNSVLCTSKVVCTNKVVFITSLLNLQYCGFGGVLNKKMMCVDSTL